MFWGWCPVSAKRSIAWSTWRRATSRSKLTLLHAKTLGLRYPVLSILWTIQQDPFWLLPAWLATISGGGLPVFRICAKCSFEWGPRPCWPFGRIQILLAAPSLAPKPGELWHFKSKCQGYIRKVYQWGSQSCDTRKTIQHRHEGESGDEGADHHDEDKNDTNMCVCVQVCLRMLLILSVVLPVIFARCLRLNPAKFHQIPIRMTKWSQPAW